VADQKGDHDIRASWVSEAAGAHDQTLVENWLLRLRRERFRSRKSGKTHDFFVAYLTDGVHVVAVTPENEIVMVRQFRVGLHRDSLETPGGLIEPGEDQCIAGARELLEETGYAGDAPMLLGTISPNPGFLAQRIATIVIRNARRIAEPAPDQTEELTVLLVPVPMIHSLIKTGGIEHGVCVAGLLWWLAQSEADRGKP
jgi:8-oxo-dGTP pyrophosphatase MutT (NUDIX family)